MENSKNSEADRRRASERRRHRSLRDELLSVLRDRFKLAPEIPLYVAYSGGMDSHVLLHSVASLRRVAPWQISALHVDHGLQPDSRQWEAHCAAVCATLNIPYQSERVIVRDVGGRGVEDAARRARYAAFAGLLPAGAVLLTAHHRNDQAETLLLQLLRGAGIPGLAAMSPIVPFARGWLARPFLGVERAALALYASEHQLGWIEDASNFDVGPARNFLRRRVWPALSERWPRAAERVAATAAHLAETDRLLDELATMDLGLCLDPDGALNIPAVEQLSLERRSNLLRYWVRTRIGTSPPESALREISARIAQVPRTRHAAVKWADIEVRRYRDRLLVGRSIVPAAGLWETSWDLAGTLEIPGVGWQLCAQLALGVGISCERIAGKVLRVRKRRGGESCRLRGHRHKVKKLLQEAGIPPWERGHWPLVYADDELVAVGDRWVCEPFAASVRENGWVLQLKREVGR